MHLNVIPESIKFLCDMSKINKYVINRNINKTSKPQTKNEVRNRTLVEGFEGKI